MNENAVRARVAIVVLALAPLGLIAGMPAYGQSAPGAVEPRHTHGASVADKPAPEAQGANTGTMDMHAKHMAMMQVMADGTPRAPGQDAFGAIQEIVQKLESDPKTDWSKVDLEALRRHLVDMNEVTLNAVASTRAIDGGVEIAVSGTGRTLAAIQRMIPAHAHEINGHDGWSSRAVPSPDGELLTVTSSDPKQVAHIRGLGFIGLLVTGTHHQAHHLAMAKGEFAHSH